MLPFPALRQTALAAALLFPASLAFAQEDPGWVMRCTEKTQCTIAIALNQTGTDQRILTFLTVLRAGTEPMTVSAALPLGTALAPGAMFLWGGMEIPAAFEVCLAEGCRATAILAPEQREALVAAESVEVRFFPYGSDHPVAVTLPMNGFQAKLDEADAELSAQ